MFLNRISFGGHARSWDALQNADVVVEPSFGSRGFGRPDAVALLELEEHGRIVIFFEAKICSYSEDCRLPSGRSKDGFNSCINGQLELNHRLAIALQRWNSSIVLKEDDWVLNTSYGVSKIRAVKDKAVIDALLNPIAHLNSASYLHVILTADRNDPFEDPKNNPYLPQVFLPSSSVDEWASERARFGWVGWREILALAQTWESADEPSWLLPNWAFLEAKLIVDDPAISAAPPSSPAWTASRPVRGVSLIFAPQINPRTYVHFSWLRERCALRDYSLSATAAPEPDCARQTNQVLAIIEDEIPMKIRRPAYTDVPSWHQRIIEANNARGLQG